MRSVLIMIFALGILASAGSAQTEAKQEPKAEVRRLESVTWDLMSHTLRWTPKKGTEVNGEFIPVAEEPYEIKPERRRFELQEAALLHRLKVWAAGDDGDILAGSGEARCQMAADGAGAEHANLHNVLKLLGLRYFSA